MACRCNFLPRWPVTHDFWGLFRKSDGILGSTDGLGLPQKRTHRCPTAIFTRNDRASIQMGGCWFASNFRLESSQVEPSLRVSPLPSLQPVITLSWHWLLVSWLPRWKILENQEFFLGFMIWTWVYTFVPTCSDGVNYSPGKKRWFVVEKSVERTLPIYSLQSNSSSTEVIFGQGSESNQRWWKYRFFNWKSPKSSQGVSKKI